MKTFNIYKHKIIGFEAVKVGFSWPAFIFGFYWMLVKKLWAKAGLWFVLSMSNFFISDIVGASPDGSAKVVGILVLLVVSFACLLIPGVNGNQWRENRLSALGYELVNTTEAKNAFDAIQQQSRADTKLKMEQIRLQQHRI